MSTNEKATMIEKEGEKAFDAIFGKFERLMKVIGRKGSEKSPLVSYLIKYRQIYNKTDKKQHIEYFSKIYKSNRNNILQGYANDGWLTGGSIVIMYGSEVGVQTKGKIHLSTFYKMACKLQEQEDTQYSEFYMLYLYQIFKLVAPTKDHEKIDTQLAEIQDMVSDVNEATILGTAPQPQDPFGGILSALTNLINPQGQPGQESNIGQVIQNTGIPNMISQISQDPHAKTLITDIVSDVQKATTPTDMLNSVINRLGNPELTNAVNHLVNNPQINQMVNNLVPGLFNGQNLGQALGQPPGQNLGQNLGQALGQALGQQGGQVNKEVGKKEEEGANPEDQE